MASKSFSLIGPGRAGRSLAAAMSERGWQHRQTFSRHDDPSAAAQEVEVVLVAVPDDSIATVAALVQPGPAVLIHLSGVKTLDVLAPHARVASLHPLVSLPDEATGCERLLAGATPMAVSGHPVASEVVRSLGGRELAVDDRLRPLYHATAAIAANHLVALCDQVDLLAQRAGVPTEVYWELMTTTLANVVASGPAAALTGPAARGDTSTLDAHIASLPETEVELYRCLSRRASELASRGRDEHPSGPPGASNASL